MFYKFGRPPQSRTVPPPFQTENATETLVTDKMAGILGIEPRLRVSETPLLPLQSYPNKLAGAYGIEP